MNSKYSSVTPSNYAFSDPVSLNDPLGDDPWWEYGSNGASVQRTTMQNVRYQGDSYFRNWNRLIPIANGDFRLREMIDHANAVRQGYSSHESYASRYSSAPTGEDAEYLSRKLDATFDISGDGFIYKWEKTTDWYKTNGQYLGATTRTGYDIIRSNDISHLFGLNSFSELFQNDPNAAFLNAIDGLVLPNDEIVSKEKLSLSFEKDGNLAQFRGSVNGKYKVNFDLSEWFSNNIEFTKSNIRNVAVHEIYGHGIKGFSLKAIHYFAYEAQIEHNSFDKTTANFKKVILSNAYDFYYSQVPKVYKPFPYMKLYYKYVR